MSTEENDPSQGALAEYASLRGEIATRINLQHQVIALHMTAVSVVFSVTLTSQDRWPMLLVIPFISYVSSESMATLFRTVDAIATYINDELSPKVNGGLGWESWLKQNRPDSEAKKLTHPYYLLFPGTSIVALVATASLAAASIEGVKDIDASSWVVAASWPLAATATWLSYKAIRELRAPF
ncbi:hypothetical protein F9278_25395 [Streptomyces phaeolivaceus]|uniref:Uncharacterized protein n=1 Tax=Streptomyces phaeolivaceus TaxID=2653200 RepID=A0A5P8K6H6_9ACTN|nr:hypothetical protein [Streptomyces phaeolivaceus]QFQ98933.1 hypothetical protein F9278_25395 [Streptomyces phaeolivaceus]